MRMPLGQNGVRKLLQLRAAQSRFAHQIIFPGSGNIGWDSATSNSTTHRTPAPLLGHQAPARTKSALPFIPHSCLRD